MHAIYCHLFMLHNLSNVWNRKINTFQNILNEIRLREPAMMFMNHNASQDDIVKNKNADIKFIAHGTFLE
jgi:hypothetical protein